VYPILSASGGWIDQENPYNKRVRDFICMNYEFEWRTNVMSTSSLLFPLNADYELDFFLSGDVSVVSLELYCSSVIHVWSNESRQCFIWHSFGCHSPYSWDLINLHLHVGFTCINRLVSRFVLYRILYFHEFREK
jgi:hypothetical protein